MAALSQPAALVKCAVCIPAALKVNPFHEYGKADGQILKLVVDEEVAFTLSIKVAVLSQPAALVKCAVCVPAALKIKLFHEYGKADGHILKLVVDEEVAFTLSIKVAALSQPAALFLWYVYVHAEL